MSTSEARRRARAVEGLGYDGTTFTGARVLRVLSGGLERAAEIYLLVLDDDLPAQAVLDLLTKPTRELLDDQRFVVHSDLGPTLVYTRSLSGPDNDLLEVVRTTPFEYVPQSETVSWGPFNAEAQLDPRYGLAGFRAELCANDDVVEVIGLLIGLPAESRATAARYIDGLSAALGASHSDVDVYDTPLSRPHRNALIYRSRARPIARDHGQAH